MRPATSILPILLAGGFLVGAAALAPHARAAEETHHRTLAASTRATGTITAIDMATRHVTIRNADGEENTFAVGKSVRLERAKVGDKVQVDYSVAVALSLKKGGGAPRERVEAASAARNEGSGPPGIQATSRTQLVADVLEVDRKTRMARLKGPEGHVVDVEVKDDKVLADIKPGDQVLADVTEAVAVSLHSAPASAASSASK